MSSGNPEKPNFDELSAGDPFADLSGLEGAAEPAQPTPAENPTPGAPLTEQPAAEPHAAEGAEAAAEGAEAAPTGEAGFAGLTEGAPTLAGDEVPPLEEPPAEPEEDKEAKPSIWKRLSESNPYTVMLGLAFVAVLVACFFLFLELWNYGFDVSAKAMKQRAMAAPVQSLWTQGSDGASLPA